MTTLNPLQRAPQGDIATESRPGARSRDDVPSLAIALRGLLADARMGRVRAAAPGDRWLALRIEEALRGFDDIQRMAIGHEPARPIPAGVTAGKVSISAGRVRVHAQN